MLFSKVTWSYSIWISSWLFYSAQCWTWRRTYIKLLLSCAFSGTIGQPRTLPMGGPGSCRLHHYIFTYKRHIQTRGYWMLEWNKLSDLDLCEPVSAAGSDNTASHLSRLDVTDNFDLLIKTNSPESCQAYLMNLEKRGNPHTDSSLLNKLKDCYSKVFSKLPIRQFSKNASYAKILVRYAELRGWVWVRGLKHHFSLGFSFLWSGIKFYFINSKDTFSSDFFNNILKSQKNIYLCFFKDWRSRWSAVPLYSCENQLQRVCLRPHSTRSVWGFSRYLASSLIS